jgi:hypothetical protein
MPTAPIIRATNAVAARPAMRGTSRPTAPSSSSTPIVTVRPGPMPISVNPATTVASRVTLPIPDATYTRASSTCRASRAQRRAREPVVVAVGAAVAVMVLISSVVQLLG